MNLFWIPDFLTVNVDETNALQKSNKQFKDIFEGEITTMRDPFSRFSSYVAFGTFEPEGCQSDLAVARNGSKDLRRGNTLIR